VPAYNVENHIRDSLNSLINQSFTDFEVIIVNDGSTDSTQDIIDEYCEKYSNFISINQKNKGVAVARNNAIKIAKGDYICFLDPDGDYYVNDSLENINKTIINKNINADAFPDLIIGRQTMVDSWSSHSYENAKELSNLSIIEPYDKRILWTMSLINKAFSRKKIIEIGLLMPNLTHASDAVFTLSFIYSCDTIVGCPHEFLIYRKRLFLDEYSLSQKSDIETINDYFSSYETIEKCFILFAEKYRKKLKKQNKYDKLEEFEEKYLEYLDEFRYREAAILFIDQIYRFFWRMDEGILERCKEILIFFKAKMNIASWERLQRRNKDIFLNDLIIDKEKMAKNPIITIVVNKFEKKTLERIMSNIYNSHFPSFEVFLSKCDFNKLDKTFKSKKNVKIIDYFSSHDFKNFAIDNSNGKYIMFVDEDIFFSPKIFKSMFDKIDKSNFDWLIDPMCSITEAKFSNKDTYNINKFSKREIINISSTYDSLLSDKLFKKEFLKNNDFNFSNNIQEDIKRLYELGEYKRINTNFILTNNDYLKNPFISLIIDDMKISNENLNNLFESIYKQNFKSFDVILNGKLEFKTNNKFLKKSNLYIIENNNFKKIAIKKSKAKYGIFINIPIFFDSNSLKNLFLDIEAHQSSELDYAFSSSPFYQLNFENIDGDNLNRNIDKKSIKNFSSQSLAYTYKDLNLSYYRSKFMIFDLYLSNKLFNIKILKDNNIYFENPHKDVLNLYKNFKFSKINQKALLTNLNQKNLFKSSFNNEEIPFLIKLSYYLHKLIFLALILRRILKNIVK
jgi:glycosyltransferase involved in cell wall biosynthesis